MPTVKPDRSCTRCPLHEQAQTVCLMGRGAIPSNVMLVGEAPGFREDDIGKPFSGSTGRDVLDPCLHELGVSRQDIYITNTVRCRPPDNRTPRAKEIAACRKWMDKELRLVKPEFVLLMGRIALKNCPKWNRAKISEVRGRVVKHEGITYMATYHPSACLPGRDARGKNLASFKSDLASFFRMVRGETQDHFHNLNIRYVTDVSAFNEMIDAILATDLISLDSETMGLDQWQKDAHITSLQFGLEKEQWYLPIWAHHTRFWRKAPFHTDSSRNKAVKVIAMALRGKKIVTQGGQFDSVWLYVEHGVKVLPWFDCLASGVLLDENEPHALAYQATKHFGAPDYDISTKEKQGYGISMRRHAKYSCLDVYYTRMLCDVQIELLAKDPMLRRFFWRVWMPMYRNYIRMRYNGVYVDPDEFEAASMEAWRREGKPIDQLNRIRPNTSELSKNAVRAMKKRGIFKGLNWNSPKQLGHFLYEILGMPILEHTKTGQPSTSESVLKRLAAIPKKKKDRFEVTEVATRETHNLRVWREGQVIHYFSGHKQDVPKLVIEYRKAKKFNEFIESWRSFQDENHLMHPRFKVETVTGRASCEEPNIQQTPRDPRIRGCITAPPGWTHIAADYSQIELRIAAMYANEKTMKYVFQTGGDIHAETVVWVLGQRDFTKEDRKKAKAVNFGFIYGMGWRKFQIYARDKYEVAFSDEESQDARSDFFRRYSDLPRWHSKQRRIVHRNGFVRTLMGRKRRLPTVYSNDEAQVHEAERQAINSPIQGSAAELHYAAANHLMKHFSPKVLRVVATVHDELLMWVKNSAFNDSLLSEIKEIMEYPEAARKLGVRYTVPIIVEIKVGPWGKGEEWKPSA